MLPGDVTISDAYERGSLPVALVGTTYQLSSQFLHAGVHGHQMQRRLNATDCTVEVLQFISLKFKRGVHEKPCV